MHSAPIWPERQERNTVSLNLYSPMNFSIRDLFWLTALVALAVGWWVDRSHLRHEMSKMRYRIVIGGPSVGEHGVLPNSQAPAPNSPKP
jgi:hypothetical protein